MTTTTPGRSAAARGLLQVSDGEPVELLLGAKRHAPHHDRDALDFFAVRGMHEREIAPVLGA